MKTWKHTACPICSIRIGLETLAISHFQWPWYYEGKNQVCVETSFTSTSTWGGSLPQVKLPTLPWPGIEPGTFTGARVSVMERVVFCSLRSDISSATLRIKLQQTSPSTAKLPTSSETTAAFTPPSGLYSLSWLRSALVVMAAFYFVLTSAVSLCHWCCCKSLLCVQTVAFWADFNLRAACYTQVLPLNFLTHQLVQQLTKHQSLSEIIYWLWNCNQQTATVYITPHNYTC